MKSWNVGIDVDATRIVVEQFEASGLSILEAIDVEAEIELV